MQLRKAKMCDVPAMQRLINHFADQGEMLHRSLSELYENLRDFYVVEEAPDQIVACGALHIAWKDLAEVKSLAVAEETQGKGYGRAIVNICIEEANALGINRLFALTFKPVFFEKLGFYVADRSALPRKVWTECIYCPKFPDCGEIAVILDLGPVSNALLNVINK